MLPFIVAGLVTGAVYGLAGVGLVLTYKVSGIFNFAHGAVATIAAYVFYTLHVTQHVAWPLAAVISVLLVAAVMSLAFERLAQAIGNSGLAVRVASMVGALLVIQAAVVLIYGVDQTRTVPVFLGEGTFTVGGTVVQYSSLVTFLVAVVATGALYGFFHVARTGVAMRAVVESPELVELAGTSSPRVRRAAWFIGTLFATASGVLLASLLSLDATSLTLLVVQAFGAAALGGFASLPLTFGGGLAIGVLASLSTNWFQAGLLAGLPPSMPFLVLFAVLLVFPRRYVVEHASVIPRPRATWSAPRSLQVGGSALLLVVLALVPTFAGIHIIDWTTAVATVIVFLSLGLLVRTSGQVSLCHVGFMAIGAAGLAHLTQGMGLPWGAAVVVAGLIAVPIGALLAIPAIRLTGLYLALATFGFGVLLSYMFYTQGFMFGDTGAGLVVPRPTGASGDTAFYYLVLALAVVATAIVLTLNRSRLGRLLRGMAESPTALATSGTSVNVSRVIVFCLSAAMAAVGGALAAAAQQQVDLVSYPALLSLTYFALIIIVGGREPWYAVVCGLALVMIPSYVQGANTSNWLQLIFGAAVIAYAVIPAGYYAVPAVLREVLDNLFRRRPVSEPAISAPAAAPPSRPIRPGALAATGVSVRFGGLVALDQADLEAPTGRITGLIGPNGAGKTTLFNVCSGLVRAKSGRVLLDGRNISHASPQARARLSLGRTFQRMELFDSLSVWDNVAIGVEGHLAGSNPVNHLLARRHDHERTRLSTEHALRLCEIAHLADQPAGTLSTGQRRLVELSRLLAGPSRILLLDEPSSGLDKAETARFGVILRQAVAERGVGILLVEHDMDLVMEVCEHVYVLNFGRMIFDGPPSAVRASPLVQSAYLGVEGTRLGSVAP